jgi:hypothetical protein
MLKPNELVYRFLQRLPIRMLSLRSIVIVAALAVVALVLTLGVWVWVGVTNDQYSQLDRRLDSVSSLGDFSTLLSGPPAAGAPSPDGNVVRTVRVGSMAMSVPTSVVLPELADGYANTTINGVEYRVRTFTVGGASIALGAPVAPVGPCIVLGAPGAPVARCWRHTPECRGARSLQWLLANLPFQLGP